MLATLVHRARHPAALLRQAVDRYRDWRLGIQADGYFVPAERLTDESYHHYSGTSHRSFRETMRRLAIRAGQEVFLDYGSGKGRVVVMAAQYPFRRVMGLEVSPELHAIALRNVERARSSMVCREIQLVVGDACRFPVPADLSVAYFYSPFHGDLLVRTLRLLRRSCVEHPRRLRLAFKNPRYLQEETAPTELDWLQMTDEYFCDGHCHAIYESR